MDYMLTYILYFIDMSVLEGPAFYTIWTKGTFALLSPQENLVCLPSNSVLMHFSTDQPKLAIE